MEKPPSQRDLGLLFVVRQCRRFLVKAEEYLLDGNTKKAEHMLNVMYQVIRDTIPTRD